MDKEEWEVELESRKIIQEVMITDMRKNKFIEEIKSGLGEQIIKEPNKLQTKESNKGFLKKLKKIFFND
jgi:hypothetical protein